MGLRAISSKTISDFTNNSKRNKKTSCLNSSNIANRTTSSLRGPCANPTQYSTGESKTGQVHGQALGNKNDRGNERDRGTRNALHSLLFVPLTIAYKCSISANKNKLLDKANLYATEGKTYSNRHIFTYTFCTETRTKIPKRHLRLVPHIRNKYQPHRKLSLLYSVC